ncbi:arylsulfatase [Aporhodopirellula aestuarii]|uniref:Arylsulfatase n=1 Tax=Aporhodopirellula aestuarii TaxID=2950107 RepID=A0ABT0U9B2_9BACT|nr:arylsulfatase [Aporhodopirellula aestuarii]MCM2373564.1 arylsulfatase [Aporhodopirellula aestuarii]
MKKLILCLLALASPAFGYADQTQPPNVIFILADDLGYGDLSCYGQTKFETPNIDALAARGMRFMQHYSGSTVCAPSRCSLLTGLHTGHTPVKGNAEYEPEGQMPMPADTFTVGHFLQSAGYETGLFGKWGLGYPGSVSDPMKMGFDRFYGYNCQRLAHCYYPAFLWNDDERELLWGNVASHTYDYAPDFIHRQALDFIRSNKEQPFFCYYAAIQPHADMIAPEAYMKKFRGKLLPETSYPDDYYIGQAEPHAAFAAMVTVLDDYVGEIVAELDTLGIADSTLVIFSSDNGPHEEGGHDPKYFDSNGVMRGIKRDLYEGGVRVPMIATWPGKIKAGSQSDHVSAFWDFLPTMADLTATPLDHEVDGVSMLPTLLGKSGQKEHEYLYWEFPAQGGREAIRKGDWKAVRYNTNKKPNAPPELFDLSTDVEETTNVAATHPEIVQELSELMSQARSD